MLLFCVVVVVFKMGKMRLSIKDCTHRIEVWTFHGLEY